MAPGCVVFYHYPCPDGAFAALCAHLAFPAARFVPLTVWAKEAEKLAAAATLDKEDTAYLLDFSGGMPFIAACCAAAKAVVLLDHHKTAQEDLAALPEGGLPNFMSVFDMSRSGCAIARDHFGTAAALEAAVGAEGAAATLEVLSYVADNDLFRHCLEGSKLAALGFAEWKGELDVNKNPSLWQQLLLQRVEALITVGSAAKAKQDAVIAREAATARPIAIPYGEAVLTCLALVTEHPDYRSVAGNLLAEASVAAGHVAAGAIAYSEAGLGVGPSGQALIKVSLRSVGDVDTTPVSRAYGGGGHKNASSFLVEEGRFAAWFTAEGAGDGETVAKRART
jgi:hypothetical protein